MPDVNPDEVIETLIRLHFFRFTAAEDMNRAIENVRRNFIHAHDLDSTDEQWSWYSDSAGRIHARFYGIERRVYHADAEDLAEGGVCDIMQEMSPVLEREGVHITSCQDEASWDDEGECTSGVIVNGQRYKILDTHDAGHDWDMAHRRTIEITNSLLEAAGSQERLFGQASGNDAGVILLTEDLFRYIRTLPLDALCVPYRAETISLGDEA